MISRCALAFAVMVLPTAVLHASGASTSPGAGPATRPAAWPPTLTQVIGAAPAKTTGIGFEFKDGEAPTLDLTVDPKVTQEWHFQLVSVYYFSGERFLGIFQKLLDESELGSGVNYELPPTPKQTDTIVAELRTCLFFEHDPRHHTDLRDKRYVDWFFATVDHFTTSRIIDHSYVYEIWTRQMDCDLESWMRTTGITFDTGIATSELIHLKRK